MALPGPRSWPASSLTLAISEDPFIHQELVEMWPIPAISLSLEPANLSAIANDVGPEVSFIRRLLPRAKPEDVAIGISTSGGSANVVLDLEEARKLGLLTVGLLGYGGEIVRRGLVDHALVVRSDYIPRIQEAQASTCHVLREALAEDGRVVGVGWQGRGCYVGAAE